MGRTRAPAEANQKITKNLAKIYEIGVCKAWFISSSLEKINELRDLLSLPPRPSALPKGQLDAEVVEILKTIDFSTLDSSTYSASSNARFFLTMVPCTYIAAASVEETTTITAHEGTATATAPPTAPLSATGLAAPALASTSSHYQTTESETNPLGAQPADSATDNA